MPLTVNELNERSWDGTNRLVTKWIVYRSDDEAEVLLAVLNGTPDYIGSFTREAKNIGRQDVGGGVWSVTVPYGVGDVPSTELPGSVAPPGGGEPGKPAPPQPENNAPVGPEWTWVTSGGTTHITQSLKTIYSIRRQDPAVLPNVGLDPAFYGGAIGVTKDGKVEGCDIYSPSIRITYTTKAPGLTHKYMRMVEDMTPTVNSKPILGRAKGEVLFLGATENYRAAEGPSLVAEFLVSKNRTNIELAPGLIVPDKNGWDYLWVTYATVTTKGVTGETPLDAFVERVYEYDDLNKLGLFAPPPRP